MVSVTGSQVFDDDDPIPITTATDAQGFPEVALSDMEALLDVLERIQQQLGQINNGNNLNPGERFE